MISKKETHILKAVSILAIIVCHFYGWIDTSSAILSRISSSLSQSGVFLFLFLSGYGICKSYKINALKNYWKKRLSKIYIPFLLVVIPQFLLKVWNYRNNISDMYIASTVLSAFGLYPNNLLDGTLWFVCYILFEYVLFYLLCKSKVPIKYLCLLGGILSYVLLKWKFDWVKENDIYGVAFWLGIFYAEYENKGFVLLRKKLVFLPCSFIVYAFSLPYFEIVIFRAINGLSLSCFMLLAVKFLTECEKHTDIVKKPLKVIETFGTFSYELYLTEGIFFWNKILYDFAGYNYIGLMLHLCIIIVLAVMIQKLSAIINRFVFEKARV